MSTRIYANGVRATALTNIGTDLASYISNNADGVLVIDRQGLKSYLITQFEAISTTPEYVSPATAATSLAAARAVAYDHLIDQLEDAIGVNHWSGRADWPSDTSVLKGAALVSAVKDGITACKRAADALTGYYATINSRLSDMVTAFYYGQGIDHSVTPAVLPQIETRSVIYTYVTDRDEESAPSPASALVELDQNDTATYTMAAPPTGRSVNRLRIYRSRSSNTGADFAFVAEQAVGTLTYTDSKKAEELGEPCPSITWIEPPADLIGVAPGPNGGMAGFRLDSNDAYFCENFVPHAWPDDYRKTTAWPIVGIGSFGQTYVVLTRGKPYYVTGADSSTLDVQPIDSNQACVSRRSIVNIDGGVMYASPDGLCFADASGVKLVTAGIATREQWQTLNPDTIIGCEYDGTYFFVSSAGNYAFDLSGASKLVTISGTASALFRDVVTDTMYAAVGPAIVALFRGTGYRTGAWRSKIAAQQRTENWSWAQVYSGFEHGSVTLKVYRDGTLTDTKTVSDSKPVRLSSVRAREYEIRIDGTSRVTSVVCASTTEELRQL